MDGLKGSKKISVIDLSKVSELTLRNDDNDCQTVLKASNLWGTTVEKGLFGGVDSDYCAD